MDELNISNILNRDEQEERMRTLLEDFNKNKHNLNINKTWNGKVL